MNNQEAKALLIEASKYLGGTNGQKQVSNALNNVCIKKGWGEEDEMPKFVQYAIEKFEEWRKTRLIISEVILGRGGDAERIAKYCDWLCDDDLETM